MDSENGENRTVYETEGKRCGWRFLPFLCGTLFGAVLTGVILAFSLGMINISFLQSILLQTDPTQTVASASSAKKFSYGRVNLKLHIIQEILEKDYFYDEDVQAVEDGIFTGMMYGLTEQDNYAAYYPAAEYAEELNDTKGNYYGIGAEVTQNIETGVVTIVDVYDGSPAQEGGLQAGDVLKAVDGLPIDGMSLDEIVDDHVKGPEGTTVSLLVERDGEEITLSVKRGKVEIPSVYASLLAETEEAPKTGYIYVESFTVATVEQFKKAIDTLSADGAEGIVIDLRDNLGGVMQSALSMLDYLLEDNIGLYSNTEEDGANRGKTLLLYTENKQGRNASFYASDKHAEDVPIVLIVNGYSASASEIFASVIKDYGRAKLVGTQTYGKGIVQTELGLPDGSAIKYTSEQYFSPSGYAVHGKGVTPDVQSEPSEAFLEEGADAENPDPAVDNQLADAIRTLYDK